MNNGLKPHQIVLLAMMMGICGCAIIFAASRFNITKVDTKLLWGSFAGAFTGGALTSSWFGHPDCRGWTISAIAAIVATVIGSILATLFMLVPAYAGFGPLGVIFLFTEEPLSFLVWLVGMTIIHLVVRKWRLDAFERVRLKYTRK